MNLSKTQLSIFFALLLIFTMQKCYPQGCSLSSTNTRSMPYNFYGFNGASLITLDETLIGGCSGTGWAGTCLLANIDNVSFRELRYPAGTVANYWNWYDGWFLPNKKMPTGYSLLPRFENYVPKDCDIPTFAVAAKKAAVTPIFNINLLTSDKFYQAAMLYRARALNLSIQNLELGNEFYHDNKLNVLKYPTPSSHITDANNYLNFFSTHFPTGVSTANPFIQSAVVGAVTASDEASYGRRNTWLGDLASTSGINSEAITLHNYISSGLGTDEMQMDGSNLHVAFYNALSNMLSANGKMNQALSTIHSSSANGKDIWATEYNYMDGNHKIAGTWAHGLFTLTMGLTYLENLFGGETLITKADCHGLVGNASSHVLFENEYGFDLVSAGESYYEYAAAVTCGTLHWQKKVPTVAYGLTASGITLKILGNATHGATTATRIDNDGCHTLKDIDDANEIDGLYGWLFEKQNDYTAVIVNLTDINVCNINIYDDVFSTIYSGQPFTIDQYFPSAACTAGLHLSGCGFSFNPSTNLETIPGVLNAVLGIEDVGSASTYTTYQSRNVSHFPQTGLTTIDLKDLPIPEYSITVIKMPKSDCPEVKLYCDLADENKTVTVCGGTDFWIKADGFGSSTPISWWSSNSTDVEVTPNETGDLVMVSIEENATNGPYYVTCVNDCSYDEITINVIPPVTVEFTEFGAPFGHLFEVPTVNNVCPINGSFNISAEFGGGLTGFYSAIWFDSDGHGIGDVTSETGYPVISIDVDSPDKIYYIVASDGLCYSGFDSVRIKPYNVITMPPHYYKCSGGGVNSINLQVTVTNPAPSATYSYLWSDATSLNPKTVISTSNTVYTVTVSSSGGTCSGTYTLSTSVHVEPYCNCNSTSAGCSTNCEDILPGARAADFSTINSGKNIYIQGHSFIDADITFTNCNLFFDQGASMTVINPVDPADVSGVTELEFLGCTLTVCGNNKWDGLIMQDINTSIKMNKNGSTGSALKNAHTGISAYNDSKLDLRSTTFAENTRHIYVANFVNEADCEIYDCEFKAPVNGTDTCISIDNVEDMKVGNDAKGINTFENYTGGVYACNSSCKIYNNSFDGDAADLVHVYGFNNMTLAGNPWPPTTLTIGGKATNEFNRFNNYNDHVRLKNVNAYILKNAFNDAKDAILSDDSRDKSITITQNEFNTVDKGITINDALQTRLLITANNPIDISTSTGDYGLMVSDNTNTASNGAKMTIQGNRIFQPMGTYGMWFENLDMPFITTHDNFRGINDNTVVMQQTTGSGYIGIRLENCSNVRVTENESRGTPGYALDKVAISLSQSPSCLVSCNETDRTYTGIQFIDNCFGADLKENLLNIHSDGLTLGITGVTSSIGPQVDPNNAYTMGNEFNPTGGGSFGVAAMHSYSSNAGFYQFWVDNTITNVTNPAGSNMTSGGTVFNLVVKTFPQFGCSDLLLKISYTDTNHNNINLTNQNKFLNPDIYSSIITDTIISDGSMIDCHSYELKTYVFGLFNKDSALKNSSQQYVQFFDSATQGNLGKFSTIKHLFFLATDSSQIYNDSALIAFYLNEANIINQSIIPLLIVEENQKSVYNLNINKILKRNFDFNANEQYLINAIAEQCPYSGGPAVTEARAMQRHWNDTIRYDNVDICINNLPKIKAKQSETEYIAVYPNPSSGLLFLTTVNPGRIVIRDGTGRDILSKEIIQGSSQIDVQTINSGVYQLTFYSNRKLSATKRISIIR